MSEPTIAEQKTLIKTIKTPERFFKVDFGRYGGEVAMGEITKEQYTYWVDKEDEFSEYISNMGFDSDDSDSVESDSDESCENRIRIVPESSQNRSRTVP